MTMVNQGKDNMEPLHYLEISNIRNVIVATNMQIIYLKLIKAWEMSV